MGRTNKQDPEAPATLSMPQLHLSGATQTFTHVVLSLTQTLLSHPVNFAQPIMMFFRSPQWTLLSAEHISQTDAPPHGISQHDNMSLTA